MKPERPKGLLNIRCTTNGVFKVHVKIKDDVTKAVKIDNCIRYGVNSIQKYLSEWNLKIYSPSKEDLENILENVDDICGDMGDVLASVIDEMLEESEEDYSVYESSEGIRLTYFLAPISDRTKVLGIISAVINYKESSLNVYDFYSKLMEVDNLYIEIGCSNQSKKYKEFATGTNYFIRVFVLLKAFELQPIRKLWGSASGTIKGENSKLREEHIKRKCTFIGDTKYYECDPIAFLNTFFSRITSKDLLKYTKKY